MHMGKCIAVVVLLALLSGCSSYPIEKSLRGQAQPLTYTQVVANPKSTRGATVIWGGRIIETINNASGGEIYVLQLPLSRREKPADDDSLSNGRFIVVSSKLLDPMTYARGRLITVAGQLGGVRNERLQSALYRYPMVDIQQTHLWSNPPKDYYYFYYGAYPDWYWGYYYPLWWGGGVGWYSPPGYEEGSHGATSGEEFRSGGARR